MQRLQKYHKDNLLFQFIPIMFLGKTTMTKYIIKILKGGFEMQRHLLADTLRSNVINYKNVPENPDAEPTELQNLS